MKQEINKLLNKFDNTNLTTYQKEQGRFEDTSQAKIANTILNALAFQLKNQLLFMTSQHGAIKELLDGAQNEVTTSKLEQKCEYLEQLVITYNELERFSDALKGSYKEITGVVFKPYAKRPTVATTNKTAAKDRALALLERTTFTKTRHLETR